MSSCPAVFDLPLSIDRIALEADGDRVRVQDTVASPRGGAVVGCAGSIARGR